MPKSGHCGSDVSPDEVVDVAGVNQFGGPPLAFVVELFVMYLFVVDLLTSLLLTGGAGGLTVLHQKHNILVSIMDMDAFISFQ